MKKVILFILAIITISSAIYAQNTDQVKLKNGSIIRGNIVEIIPEGNVTINDLAGNTWVYAMTEIEAISEIEALVGSVNQPQGFEPGLKSMTSIGFLAGSQSSQYVAPFSMQASFGYLNKMGIYTGLTTGIEFLNISHIPLMLDIQYFMKQAAVTPVAILKVGYTLPSKSSSENYSVKYNYSGGLAGAVGMGLKIKSFDHFAWDISVLYRYMQINYTEKYEYQDYDNTYQDVYNRLELRVGVYLDL